MTVASVNVNGIPILSFFLIMYLVIYAKIKKTKYLPRFIIPRSAAHVLHPLKQHP